MVRDGTATGTDLRGGAGRYSHTNHYPVESQRQV
jgi:hypothetical protein